MSKIYCFFDVGRSREFLDELSRVIKTSNNSRIKKLKTRDLRIKSDYQEIIERIISLRNDNSLFIFHPSERSRGAFKLQVFFVDRSNDPFQSDNYLFDCDLHLAKSNFEDNSQGAEVIYQELKRKDFLSTLSDDEFIFRMLDRYEYRRIDSEEIFKKVEKQLLSIRNYNYLLLSHKLTQADLALKNFIDYSVLEQDRFVISRFIRLKKKETDGKRLISNKDEDKHHFSISLKINNETLPIDFDYSQSGLRKTRIYTIVGKNAAGKSQTLIQISRGNLVRYHKNTFFYGVDDNVNKSETTFKYINLIRTKKNSLKEDIGKIIELDKSIFYFNRKKLLQEIVNNVLGIDDIVLLDENGNFVSLFGTNVDSLNSIVDIEIISNSASYLSTGQGYFLKLIASLVSNIRYSSLLLIDEPEVFLHPNYIKELVLVLEKILNYTNSVCVLSTHSVFIVREMPKEYVKILQRDKKTGVGNIRVPAHETFGESLDILADEIFHDEDIKGFGDNYSIKDIDDIKKLSSRLASRVMNYD